MSELRIPVLLGDGIGPEVVAACVQVLEAAVRCVGADVRFEVLPACLSALDTHGTTLPAATLEQLWASPGWILGPTTSHLYSADDLRLVQVSRELRKVFDLYANLRPARRFPGVAQTPRDIDVVVVRENSQGFYPDRNLLEGNGEFRPDADTVLSLRVITRRGCLRIATEAFAIAEQLGRRRVTAVHKANVLRRGDGLFLECCEEVAMQYPTIAFDDEHVDACATRLVLAPEAFDVIVTTNLFGDILSNLVAGLAGGLGLAPGLNIGGTHAMAQAAHGSAPDIAEARSANPAAEILSGKLLLDWLGRRFADARLQRAAVLVEAAVQAVLADPAVNTPDMGGPATTAQMADAVAAAVGSLPDAVNNPAFDLRSKGGR